MAKHKSLVMRAIPEPALKKRQCRHKKEHSISQGEVSLVVREGQFGRLVYCKTCAVDMIQLSIKRLRALEADLNKDLADLKSQ